MQAVGTVVGIILILALLGVLWYVCVNKLWPMIDPYIAEPFKTFIVVAFIILLVIIVISFIVSLLSLAGVHVPFFGGLGFRFSMLEYNHVM